MTNTQAPADVERDRLAAFDAADEEAKAAEELVAALEQRVIEGDETVTAEQIEQQRATAHWAKLRLEAARRKADQAHAEAVRAQVERTIQDAAGVALADGDLISAWSSAVDTLRALAVVAAERSQRVRAAARTLEGAGRRAEGELGESLMDLGALGPRYHGEIGYRVPALGVEVTDVPPQQLVALAIETGLTGTPVNLHDLQLIGGRVASEVDWIRRAFGPPGPANPWVTAARAQEGA